jgi:hypothetical protein
MLLKIAECILLEIAVSPASATRSRELPACHARATTWVDAREIRSTAKNQRTFDFLSATERRSQGDSVEPRHARVDLGLEAI